MRKRRKSRNKHERKDQKPVKIILVEGETEANYVNYLKSLYTLNYNLRIFKRSKLEKNIKNTIDRLKNQHSVSDDELILLYDLENDKCEYDKFINHNSPIHKNTYLTQPCIEYHFLLHHKQSVAAPNKYRTPKGTEHELIKYSPKYKKGHSFVWNKSDIGFKEINLAKNRLINTFESYSQKSFSTIGKLILEHFINKWFLTTKKPPGMVVVLYLG